MMMLVIMMMMTIITFGPGAGSPVCVAGIATCSSKAPISTSLSSKTKTDLCPHITKDWFLSPYHRHHQRLIFIFISITEVGNLRYHHITIITSLTFITLSLSPKADWSLPPVEERFWRRVDPRAFASQAVLSPKPIDTVMQFPSSPYDLYDIKHSNVCNSRLSSFSLCCLGLGSANHLRQNEGLFEDTAAAKQVSVHSCLPLLISSYHFPSEQVLSCPAPVENILVLG